MGKETQLNVTFDFDIRAIFSLGDQRLSSWDSGVQFLIPDEDPSFANFQQTYWKV
jgi:hypothetical protein